MIEQQKVAHFGEVEGKSCMYFICFTNRKPEILAFFTLLMLFLKIH